MEGIRNEVKILDIIFSKFQGETKKHLSLMTQTIAIFYKTEKLKIKRSINLKFFYSI